MGAPVATVPPAGSAAPAAPGEQRYPLALIYICGAFLIGVYLGFTGISALPPVLIAALALPIAFRAGRWPAATLLLACALSLWLGACRASSAAYRDSAAQVAHYVGQSVVLTATVDGEPQPGGHGQNLPVRVDTMSLRGHPVDAAGRLLIYYIGPLQLQYGDRVSLRGILATPFRSPGFDYRAYLAGQGIHALIQYPALRLLGHDGGNPVERWALGVRGSLRRTILRMLPHDEAALLVGILLGAPTRSLGTLTDAFVAVGMIHVVAISGLKVAMVAGTIAACCRPLPRRWRWLPALGAVAIYTLISGATPSGLRSALMWSLALQALQSGRRAYVWVSLAAVAAALVAWRPLLLWDTGFQLSVVGTAGIVLFTPVFERPLHRVPPLLRESTAVTLAAQFATLPITAISFGQVSLAGPIANGLLLPLLGPLLVGGALLVAVGTAIPPLAPLLGWVLYPFLSLFIAVVRWLATLPFAGIRWPVVPLVLVLPYYALLLLLARLRFARAHAPAPRHPTGALALLGAVRPPLLGGLALAALASGAWISRPSSQPMLWVADAGGSMALLIQTPRDQNVLLDGGDTPGTLDALLGRHLPFWQRDLAAVLISEPDRAHAGGLLGITAHYRVLHAYDPGAIYPSITYARWRAELRAEGIGVRKARTGLRIDLGARVWIDVLQPPALSLDEVPAPVAYRIRLRRLVVLVANREALADDPAPLLAEGACVDALVLPPRAARTGALALVRALRPRWVLLQSPAGHARAAALQAADLAPLPAGIRVRQLASGGEFALDSTDGRCG